MSTFPELKSGAIVQSGSLRMQGFRNRALRFTDGSAQRFLQSGDPELRWLVRLDRLDDREVAQLEGFFEQMQGSLGRFMFRDPWTGQEYPGSRFESDELATVRDGENRAQGAVWVVNERRQTQ
jgi:hypothetical protein